VLNAVSCFWQTLRSATLAVLLAMLDVVEIALK
jgi:hypothetical protein